MEVVGMCSSETECRPQHYPPPSVGSTELKLHEVINKRSLDFDEWTSLISDIEKAYPDDIDKISLVYDSFLSEYPLCYGFWRKYADHKTRLCSLDKVVEVFERAAQSVTYSVDLWLGYCQFSISAFEDPYDIRRLFRRAISFVGRDYLCHALWDKYIEFEFSEQQWCFLAHIYIQTMRFPTKKLHHYYESFKKLTAMWEEERKLESNCTTEFPSKPVVDSEVSPLYTDDEISNVIKDLLDPSAGLARSGALQKYLFMGKHFYQEACQLEESVKCFETHIRRSYFHVKPLDMRQLENWHQYLDFVEMEGDFDWVVKLYERCLIPCANYLEFWMRYVDFMETKGGREIANFALERATQAFEKKQPVIHLFAARFKEHIRDAFGARASFIQFETESDSNFLENVMRKANMEKRLGNFVAACDIYKEALKIAEANRNLDILPMLYVHFAQLKYMITNSADAARDILIDGIQNVNYCKLIVEELVSFARMHGGSRHINVIDSVIANVIIPGSDASQSLSAKDREEISSLYLEFIDLCGTIDDVRKTWNRHIKLFPHSTRTDTHNCAVTSAKHVIMSTKGREEHDPCGDFSSDFHKVLQLQDKKLSPSKNGETQFDKKCATDQVQSGETANVIVPEFSPKVLKKYKENTPTINMTCEDLDHQLVNGPESVEGLQEYTKEDKVLQECVSSALTSDSVNAQTERATSALEESHQNPIPVQILSRSQVPSSTSWSGHERSYANKVRRDSKLGSRGHPQKPYKQRQISPRKHYPRSDVGSQKPFNKGHPCQPLNQPVQQNSLANNQYQAAGDHNNLISSHLSPMQNTYQPAVYSQLQTAQYPLQSSDQYVHMQNSEASNQMWQYYYYQQQQFFMQQEQCQNQQQPQSQQPDEQQLLQQYQQLQMQQHYQHYQQQHQHQQLQQQPYQQELLSQQQPQYSLQQQFELKQQQQQQQQQLQQPTYQQEPGQQLMAQQQLPPEDQPSQQQQTHEQYPQQILPQIHSWSNCNQQGQSVATSESRGASESVVSPHPEQQSP